MQRSTQTGAGSCAALSNFARLRLEVFRAFPYLYEGSPEYGESYPPMLAGSKKVIVAALEDAGLSPYSGRGSWQTYFGLRKVHARRRNEYSAFWPANQTLKASNYSPAGAFWEKRGYREVQGMIAMFSWKEIDRSRESEHPERFCVRELG
ncbi:MAG: hypothetical protein ACLPWS_22675 [Rhodomicrobium sp.]